MNDDIELPPLPPVFEWASMAPTAKTIKDYARAAVLADRERRAERARPTVHSRVLRLTDAGHVYRKYENEFTPVIATIDLCWTNDGRAWINNKRNRELARKLRIVAEAVCTAPNIARLRDAADALDGGM